MQDLLKRRHVIAGNLRSLLGYLLETNHLVHITSRQCLQIKNIGCTLTDSSVDQPVAHSGSWQKQSSQLDCTELATAIPV